MACFGVNIKEVNKRIKLKVTGEQLTLNINSSPSSKLNIKNEKLFYFNVTPNILNIRLSLEEKKEDLILNILRYSEVLIKLLALKNNVVFNILSEKELKLNLKKIGETKLIISKKDDIIFKCIASCKFRREFEYLRSLDDESLIDTLNYFLKSIIDYGIERFD